ncbi:MAG: hypothetical protein IKS10_09335 [Lachnospiraceae bacterium]|nr:hypothetical protein [Lachnospiraceae bacterium]
MNKIYDKLEQIIQNIKGENTAISSETIDLDLRGKEFRFSDIDFVYLILETQYEFGISFSEEELLRDDFRSIRAIADAIVLKTKDDFAIDV